MIYGTFYNYSYGVDINGQSPPLNSSAFWINIVKYNFTVTDTDSSMHVVQPGNRLFVSLSQVRLRIP